MASHSTLCQTVYESSTAILHATLLMPQLQIAAAGGLREGQRG